MWVNAKERLPKKDGIYKYQSVYGDVDAMSYTVKAGWNTHYDRVTGDLIDDSAIENDGYVARWADVPEPDPIPEEWLDEYREVVK